MSRIQKTHPYLRPVLNLSDVVDVKELSDADSTANSTSGDFPVFSM